ncbi:MAG: cytochrome c biogenesis protein CcsA [Bacteroidetes bacterium]|nr:cytochrome c biogenesis protein CcsA [Bacteroidota bacterium]
MIATIAFFILITALAVQIYFIIKDSEKPDPVTQYMLFVVFILLLITTIMRSLRIDFVAVTSTYEALLLFSECIVLVLAVYRFKSRNKALPFIMVGGTLISIILLALASSPIIPDEALPPVPALQSYWLVLHILFAFFGEAFFAVAFLAAIYFLVVKDETKKKYADSLIYKANVIGYFLYTTGGLLFGAIWAYNAWGRYWGWDPKETSAFVTWLVYTLYLHFRLVKKMRGKFTAIFSIVGFLLTLFTFLGVNYLMTGLHSY